jgi:D-alanyl-D-alanine endopeptidase (penicillin-binding protein 7)
MKGLRILLIVACWLSTPAAAAKGFKSRTIPDVLKNGLPNIMSAAALVVDLDGDKVLYEKDADQVRPIASISKMFGALVVVEDCNLKPDELHEMTVKNREAARGGDKTKLTTGWSFSHSDLLHAALMRSDNRALPALAEACGMEPETMAERMTAKARKMGLIKTVFKEPTGLSPENVSTPREVMIALKYVTNVPALTEIMAKSEYFITAVKGERRRPIKIRSTDRALNKGVAEVLAGKTGYTDLARYCLAIAAKTDLGQNVGMVFLGAEGRFTRFADFTRVIRWLGPEYEAARAKVVSPVVSVSSARADRRSTQLVVPYSPLIGPPIQVAPANLAPSPDAAAESSPEANKW